MTSAHIHDCRIKAIANHRRHMGNLYETLLWSKCYSA